MHKDTVGIHGGSFTDKTANSVTAPIYLSTTFQRDGNGEIASGDFLYSRVDNPNRRALEEKLALLEEGAEAFAFSSGMAACFSILHSVMEPGSHCLLPDDCYHGISTMFKNLMNRWQVSYTEIDMTDTELINRSIQKNTKLIMVESPSNPLLKITDIEAVVSIAKPHNIIVACDDTWTTPYLQTPLSLGADITFHSSTKFFGGHSDITSGCVIVKEKNAIATRLRTFQQIGGVVPSPFDCWLLSRSLATLALRLKKQMENAGFIAAFLSGDEHIGKVYYPGLPAHPGHDIAGRQMKGGYGSMLSVLVKGGKEEAMSFANNLSLFKHATSLGGVESLIEHRRSVEGDSPKSPDNLLRISVGVEDANDLIEDLRRSLKILKG